MTADWRLGLRAHPREKIFQPAHLAISSESARVHMLDISAGGVRIHTPAPLRVGAHVMLAWADHKRAAEVAWARGTKAGLRFRVPLTLQQMTMLVTRGAPAYPSCRASQSSSHLIV